MFWLFAATSFLSAALLFLVQPLLGKLLLPTFGGAPAVWTAALLFFQTALLLGYAVAHGTVRSFPRILGPLYAGLLLVAALTLPVTVDRWTTADVAPGTAVLLRLAAGVGLPFVVLSAASPLLQRAYAARRPGHDPYVLYAASNAGSFVGLLTYPFVVEPLLSGNATRALWSGGFVFAALLLASTVGPVRIRSANAQHPQLPRSRPDSKTLLTWALLAALPVSLLLGATTFITTDIAAVPLLWIIPLALYLLTFVLTFGPQGDRWSRWGRLASLPSGIIAVGAMLGAFPVEGAVLAVLLAFAALALAVHGELHRRRPETEELTLFYLVVAAGGAAGGFFNAIVAPLVFPTVLEFPLALAVAVVLVALMTGARTSSDLPARIRHMVLLVILPTAALLLAATILPVLGSTVLLAGVAGLVLAAAARRWNLVPLALILGVLALVPPLQHFGSLYLDRSFFGTYRIEDTHDGVRVLHQGTTLHGSQDLADPDVPLTYYHPEGPVGDLMSATRRKAGVDIGVVGLGTGAIAAYGDHGDTVTFHEIDPTVIDIASDPDLFTYLADSDAEVGVTVGDGRLTVADLEPATYDLLVLDAFSSDAVPAHLLTLEAFAVYGRALRPGGLLAVHVSNRHLDLAPVVQAGADALDWGSAVRADVEVESPRRPSVWTALSRDQEVMGSLIRLGWDEPASSRTVTWTDDHSNILAVLK